MSDKLGRGEGLGEGPERKDVIGGVPVVPYVVMSVRDLLDDLWEREDANGPKREITQHATHHTGDRDFRDAYGRKVIDTDHGWVVVE